jgi:starch synthase
MTQLKVLFASPEVVPFVKTGGLADVSGMLPHVLAEMGHTVAVVLPRYSVIPDDMMRTATAGPSVDLAVADGRETLKLYRMADATSSLEYFFIDHDEYFDRTSLYVDPDTGEDYPDNHIRFSAFCRAVLELLKKIDWRPDIIHANDWQTGMLPVYLATTYKSDPFFAGTKTVFTIHNLAYQGKFPAESFADLNLPGELYYPTGPFEFYGQVNLMKAAIMYATVINTVSERYAIEIQTSAEFGAGLEGVLASRKHDVHGIINGVDYSHWSPSRDTLILHRYTISNLSGKRADKVELVNRVGLPLRDHVPLIGMITRLADQKGLDLIEAAADELFALDLQMVILGTGDPKYHELLQDLEKQYPDKLRVLLKYDNEMAHWIEAGADAFLMPSRYEPCGLNQLYSLKYGTVPIVRATGGLADTIDDVDSAAGTGTGFVFEEYNPEAMLEAVRRAIALYGRKRIWHGIMKRAMSQDFSWNRSAEKYVGLYRRAMAR